MPPQPPAPEVTIDAESQAPRRSFVGHRHVVEDSGRDVIGRADVYRTRACNHQPRRLTPHSFASTIP